MSHQIIVFALPSFPSPTIHLSSAILAEIELPTWFVESTTGLVFLPTFAVMYRLVILAKSPRRLTAVHRVF